MNKQKMLIPLVLSGLLIFFIWAVWPRMRVKSYNPEGLTISASGSLSVTFTQTITNGDDISRNFKISPYNFTGAVVDNDTIVFSPIQAYDGGQTYTITIPEVRGKRGGGIKNFSFEFTAVSGTVENEEGPTTEMTEEFVLKKYPYMKDLLNSPEADFTAGYGFPYDVFTVELDIQPYISPDQRQTPDIEAKRVIETYNKFTAILKKHNVKPEDVPTTITPDTSEQIIRERVFGIKGGA